MRLFCELFLVAVLIWLGWSQSFHDRIDRLRGIEPPPAAVAHQAQGRQEELLQLYRRSVISAFADVENALVDQTKFGQVRTEQGRNVAALRRFRDLAELRYREGATIYLEVANAEQSLFNAELAYVATQAQLFQSYANLYRAMGGGWIEEAERLTSRQD